MAKYVTILDIARELGISKSTVSRALSGDTSNVKAATIERILETAHRMGYHRNELAVNLRKQSTHNIGIIIPEIITSFYMNFVNHVQGILRKEGYKVIIAVSNENPEQERENIQMMEQIRVDGILMSVCNKDKNQEFRIPEDVALCCMSGTTLSTLVHPTITAVEQPVEDMAKEACRLLLSHIADAHKTAEDIALRGENNYRESFVK